jgi:hypothetical protein
MSDEMCNKLSIMLGRYLSRVRSATEVSKLTSATGRYEKLYSRINISSTNSHYRFEQRHIATVVYKFL